MRAAMQGVVIDTKDLPGVGLWQSGYPPSDPRYQRALMYTGGPLGYVLWVRTGSHYGSWDCLVLLSPAQWTTWRRVLVHWDRRKSIRVVLRELGARVCDTEVRQGA